MSNEEKILFKIDKNFDLNWIGRYIVVSIIVSFFGYLFILDYIIVWILISFLICGIEFYFNSHDWLFYSDRIDIKYKFRNRVYSIDKQTCYFEFIPGSRHNPMMIVIRYKNKNLDRLFLKSKMYYANPRQYNFGQIKKYAIQNNIELKGDWKW